MGVMCGCGCGCRCGCVWFVGKCYQFEWNQRGDEHFAAAAVGMLDVDEGRHMVIADS